MNTWRGTCLQRRRDDRDRNRNRPSALSPRAVERSREEQCLSHISHRRVQSRHVRFLATRPSRPHHQTRAWTALQAFPCALNFLMITLVSPMPSFPSQLSYSFCSQAATTDYSWHCVCSAKRPFRAGVSAELLPLFPSPSTPGACSVQQSGAPPAIVTAKDTPNSAAESWHRFCAAA